MTDITREQVRQWQETALFNSLGSAVTQVSALEVVRLCASWMALRTELDEANEEIAAARSQAGALEEKARKWDALTEPARMDEKEFAGDPVIAWRAYHEAMDRLACLRELGDRCAAHAHIDPIGYDCQDSDCPGCAWRKERET